MKNKIPFLAILLLILFFTSCQKDMYRILQVNTNTATVLSDSTATATGRVIDAGENGVKQYGHCWDTIQKPTISSNKNNLGSTDVRKDYTSTLTGLKPVKTYYVVAYASDINKAAIGGFSNDYYWSSSEYGANRRMETVLRQWLSGRLR